MCCKSWMGGIVLRGIEMNTLRILADIAVLCAAIAVMVMMIPFAIVLWKMALA